MKDDFYSQFEHAFRGTRALITARLNVYSPLVEPLIDLYPEAIALDLGCGRGEWLEILRKKGFITLGVDLDDGMLADCRALDLNVITLDAIAALNALEEESVSIVSAFHLVEHIPFDVLRTLVSEALRVLKPGGLLIMETPNPENIMVGTSSFYLDPTHTRPIPPGLLMFIPQYYGFLNTHVLRLQESPELRQKVSPTLRDVLGGASPDYAVIAQKSADENILARFKSAFEIDVGLTLDTLASRYDENISSAERAMAALNIRISHVDSSATERLDSVQQAIAALNTQIHDVYSSTSWKVTRPLRALGTGLRQLKQFFSSRR